MDDAEEVSRPIPTVGAPVEHRRLCIGMSTYDDFDGVWFTVQSIRMFHREVLDKISFVVVDNHPEGMAAISLKELEQSIPYLRYVPFRGYRGTAVRDLIFREADADIVCCIDSHVLLQPGGLAALIDWFDAHPDSLDLLQGPLWYDDLGTTISTHFRPAWGAGMYGQWDTDPRVYAEPAEPFEIGMQGLGLFACRAQVWPGLNPKFRGFGGEEGYLQEKFRQRGGRVLCHPALKWAHRFGRPTGVPYRCTHEDRIRNYLIGWSEIGWETGPIYAHAREHLGGGPGVDAMLDELSDQASSPLGYFDAIFYLRAGKGTDSPPAALSGADVAWRAEIYAASPDDDNPRRARVRSWHETLHEVSRRGYENFLVVEGQLEVSKAMLAAIPNLASQPWDICVFNDSELSAASPAKASISSALAVHSRAYKQILADVQGDDDNCASFLARWGDFDRYLDQRSSDGTFHAASITSGGTLTFGSGVTSGDCRPLKRSGLEIVEMSKGLVAYQPVPEMVCYLNNTAAFIFEMCDGRTTVSEIALAMATAFGLEVPPVGEVEGCIEGFRVQGIVSLEPRSRLSSDLEAGVRRQ